jgi:hypothetical protein
MAGATVLNDRGFWQPFLRRPVTTPVSGALIWMMKLHQA